MLRFFLSAWLVTAAAASVAEPPPPKMPLALLATPIPAAQAARHTEYWLKKGFRGFLFEGIMADVYADVWSKDGDPTTRGEGDHTLTDMRAVADHLTRSGLDRNFLKVRIGADRPYFSEPALWAYVGDRLAAAGQFCRAAGLRGIAMDCQSTSLFYSYQWDGYRYEGYTPEDVSYGALEFGSRMTNAFLREYPAAEILVIADDWLESGPLWLPMFEGMVEAVGRHKNASIHLLTRASFARHSPEELHALVARTLRGMELRFEPRTWRVWRDQGSLALGLRPPEPTKRDASSTASDANGVFRIQVAVSKLFSDDYVWLEDDGAWWRPPENDRESDSSDSSPRAVAVSSVVDAFERAGDYVLGSTPAHILRSESGAAAFLWRGGEALELRGRTAPLRVISVSTGKKHFVQPSEGAVTAGPFSEPVILDGLSVRELAVPACMWMRAGDGPSPGAKSIPLSFGIANNTGFTLTGVLGALAPAHMTIVPAAIPLSLAPGTRGSASGVLQGSAALGSTVEARLTLTLEGSPPITRAFRFPVLPTLRWGAKALGPVLAAPLATDLDGDGVSECVVCGAAGEVLCLDAAGETRWRRQFAARFERSAAAGRHWSGAPHVATVDQRGIVRVLEADGSLRWEMPLGAPSSATGAVFANLHPFPGDELAAGLADGRVLTFIGNGFPYWTYAMEEANARITVADVTGDGLCEIMAVGASGGLVCLANDGKVLWRARLAGPGACAPILVSSVGDGTLEAVTATTDGTVQVWDARQGTAKARGQIKNAQHVTALVVAQLLPGAGRDFLVCDDAAVYCLSRDFGVVWRRELAVSGAPAAVAHKGKTLILAAAKSGEIVCLNASGEVVWRDTRSAAPLTAAPIAAALGSSAATDMSGIIYGSPDGIVRALALE